MTPPNVVHIGSIPVGGDSPHILIAGPCVIESEAIVLETATGIAKIAQDLHIPYIFKASYDKANRTSISSFRGLGLSAGLAILNKVKQEVGVPILTDIHDVQDVAEVAEVVDILQIPDKQICCARRPNQGASSM
jgi:2-dehydro-3-deoxyphosphooctonate aldolase (KDO 8-P synthase)